MSQKIDIKRFVGKDFFGNYLMGEFQYYRSGFFYYAVSDFYNSDWYIFPIPSDDVGNATLNRSEKAITLMRWIRKAIDDKTFLKQ